MLERLFSTDELRLAAGGVLLRQFRVIFESLSFGQEGDCLGNLRIPFCADFESFKLTKLRGEELALDTLFNPVADTRDVGVGIGDLLVLEEGFELLHDGIVDHKFFGDGVVSEVVFAEVEEGVVDEEIILEVIHLLVVDLLIGGDASAAIDGASGVGELDLEVALVLRFVGVVTHVIVVVERDVVVVALNEAA